MQLISDFSIQSLQSIRKTDDEFQAVLLYNEAPVLSLKGVVLEGQYRCGDVFLIFISHDTPFEEILDVYLLTCEFEIKDRLSIFALYSSGIFKNASIESARTIKFSFFDEDFFYLTLLEKAKMRNPLRFMHKFIWRPFSLFTYLSVYNETYQNTDNR